MAVLICLVVCLNAVICVCWVLVLFACWLVFVLVYCFGCFCWRGCFCGFCLLIDLFTGCALVVVVGDFGVVRVLGVLCLFALA